MQWTCDERFAFRFVKDDIQAGFETGAASEHIGFMALGVQGSGYNRASERK